MLTIDQTRKGRCSHLHPFLMLHVHDWPKRSSLGNDDALKCGERDNVVMVVYALAVELMVSD